MTQLTEQLPWQLPPDFPRRVPEDMVVIDALPPGPIPASLEHIKADLLGQLALAQAPLSGRRTACVLVAEHTGYGGHIVEQSSTNVTDPFVMALETVPQGTQLYGAMVTGMGIKEKHTLPSAAVHARLREFFVPDAKYVVVKPETFDTCRVVPADWLDSAYTPKLASVFQGRTLLESQIEAIRSTTLSMEDCEFVARLRHNGLTAGIHYYLTGSASARGGPSFALRPGMYGDLDIIAVSDLSIAEIEAAFETTAKAQYGDLEKTPKIVHVAGSGRTLAGCIYANSVISIDFFPTHQLETAFVRPEYLENRYYHQLS